MTDPRVERHARLIVEYGMAIRPGELVQIVGTTLAAPLVRELCRHVVQVGAHPLPRISVPGISEALLLHGSEEQLVWTNPRDLEDIETVDVRITIDSDANVRSLTHVDPGRHRLFMRGRDPIRRRTNERSEAGGLRWLVTAHPTQAAAQEAGMSLAAFESLLYEAVLLDPDDPVGAWRVMHERLDALGERLAAVGQLRVVGDGTDLVLGVGGRAWIPCAGDGNLPDGEVFTGPVEDSVEGTIRFSYPAAFRGRGVADVRLRFEGGKVVDARAAHGEDFLLEMLDVDEGARRVGEFAFGLNEHLRTFTGSSLFDEKIGGTVHLALGESYPESGGVNRSKLHWDMVCDLRQGGQVYADGELVYRDGRFLSWP